MQMILTAPHIVCPKCGSKLFREALALKRISAIISPTGKEEYVPVPMYVCNNCGEVPDEYKKSRNYDIIMGNASEDDIEKIKKEIEEEEQPKPSIIMP